MHCNYQHLHFADRQSTFEAQIDDTERIAWLWAIVFAFCFPEFLTFFRSVRICFFKNVDIPDLSQQFWISFFEILHVIGLAILSFSILPNLDAVKGIMLTNCLCFIPAFLGLFFMQLYYLVSGEDAQIIQTFLSFSRPLQFDVAEKLQIITRGYTRH